MTKEEAIRILKIAIEDSKEHIRFCFDIKGIEALDMAIKALEQQPCEDCISREDILDAIETWDKFGVNAEQKLIRWQDHYVPYVHLDDVRNAIANMPSVTPKAKWISVSERLPKENEHIGDVCKYYLIQDEYGDMHVAHLSNVGWIPMDSLKAIGDEVIAWMPLPQPYAESEDE